MTAFPPVALEALRTVRTVEIETSAGPGRRIHRAVVWIVVDGQERVLVRSVRGARGRWYRELLSNPSGAVHVAGTRLPVVAELASDAERVSSCSAALGAKYPTSRGSLAAMVAEDVLATTLELKPA